jgi:hypothetical protein
VSHTTTLKGVVIRDTAALQSAVEDLRQSGVKCELLRDTAPRMYFGNQHGKCDFTLKLEGSYDVGFDKQADGSYVPVFDEHANHVGREIGAGRSCPMPTTPEGRAQHQIGKLMQRYSYHASVNAAVAQGYMVEGTETDEHGNLHLTLVGM